MDNQVTSFPAHPYNSRQQSGIKLEGDQAAIIYRGREVLSATLPAPITPWEFWYNLVFTDIFPDAEYWWFYSGWTQQVRLRVLKREGSQAHGLMQFVSDENSGELWFYDSGEISHPYPSGETFPGNAPLRFALARMIYQAAINNQVAQDQWYIITSLVKSEELPIAFPTLWAAPWWLTNMYDKNDARASFCALLSLKPPQ